MEYDFGGWATRNNLKCSDGRTILKDAFIECDGKTVPLVWNHKHGEANNVLGHCLLENRPEGVYCYGVFNDNPEGQGAKELVKHGDINSLSIYANGLRHVNGRNVEHGVIREVSLVLAGANPGAYIDDVICHSDDEDGAVIFTGMELENELEHADKDDDSNDPEKIFDTFTEKQKMLVLEIVDKCVEDALAKNGGKALSHADGENETKTLEQIYNGLDEDEKMLLNVLVGIAAENGGEMSHADTDNADDDDPTFQQVYNSLNENQKTLLNVVAGIAAEEGANEAEAKHSEENYYMEDDVMQHNMFESAYEGDTLMHARRNAEEMFAEAFADAKSYGSLKESVIAHGIEDIDILFPEAQTIDNELEFITRNMDWVKVFMDGVHKTPFQKVKTHFADLTEEEARAKGYIKGTLKKEQVFSLLKRETDATTVYKKQKIDRDDLIDINGRYDMVRYIRKEMDMMLREEIARAGLVGDGRDPSSDDKINPQRIRPIWTDDDFFSIKYDLGENTGRAFIEGAVKSRAQYKGSGNPILFVTEQKLTELLLLTDAVGRDLYDSVDKLATKLRVSKIVTVPVMEGCVRVDKDKNKAWALQGIIVNLNDYNMGTNRGGEIRTFDDFDIDYNAQKYLIETRCSGALIRPFSAIILETETDMPETTDNG